MPATSSSRYVSLDHWRGIAALWVVLFHAFNVWLAINPSLLPQPFAWLFYHGWLGVHLFFVISGYCIAERAAREFSTTRSANRFLLDRMLRIYPPYWAALLFALLLNAAALLTPGVTPLPYDGNTGPFQWFQAVSATEPWFGYPSYLLVAWTLAYEIGFYLIAAACLRLAIRTGRSAAGWVLAAIVTCIGVSHLGAIVPLLGLWPQFMLGVAVWLLVNRPGLLLLRNAAGTALLAGAVLLGTVWHADISVCVATGFGGLLLLLHPVDAAIASSRWLGWLGWCGTFSYAIYLIHAPVVGKVRNLLGRWWPPTNPSSLWVPFAATACGLLAAWVFYRQVERRTESWRRAYSARNFVDQSS